MRFRGDIEGLRAVAVLAVLGYHLEVPGFAGGYIGVDVFFVVSGFLITSLLLFERDRTGRIDLVGFITRRIRRLLPLASVVLVATTGAAAVWLPATRFDELRVDVIAASLFIANAVFAQRGGDYLAADLAPSPLQHFWSLAVEEQFYLVWPTLILLIGLGSRHWRRRVGVLAAVVVVVSFITGVVLTASAANWAYFVTPARAWELALGALLAVWGRPAQTSSPLRGLVAWGGLAVVVVSIMTYGRVDAFPGWIAVIPVLAVVVLLNGGDTNSWGPARCLGWRPLGWIGARSYGLYLWHWPIIVIAETVLERSLRPVDVVVVLVGTVVITELSYRGVETPVRAARRLVNRSGATLVMGSCLVVVTVAAGWTLGTIRPDLDTGVVAAPPPAPARAANPPEPERRDPRVATETDSGGETDTSSAPPSTSPPAEPVDSEFTAPLVVPARVDTSGDLAPEAIVDALAIDAVPENLRPGLFEARTDTSRLYGDGCHLYFASELNAPCEYGSPESDVTVALFGDSHAAQWFPALDAVATQRGWRLLALTQGGCPVIDVTVWNRTAGSVAGHCQAWRDAVRDRLIAADVDVVVIAQYWGLLDAATRRPVDAGAWRYHLPVLLQSLQAEGMAVVMALDTPDPPEDVPECLLDHPRDPLACTPGIPGRTEGEVRTAVNEVATAAGVSLLDPRAWLCAQDRCPVIVGDLLLYRDSHHLSAQGSTWLAPLVDSAFGNYVESVSAFRDAR